MKVVNWLRKRFKGLSDAVARYPLTTVFLIAAAVINAYDIHLSESHYFDYLLTFIVGAFLSAVAESVYERFFQKGPARYVLMGLVILLTAGYYFIIKAVPENSMAVYIRTWVSLFALLIAFIWIPSIKSKVSFNKSFLISFKAFFIALFFSGVIFGGTAVILGATDTLLFSVDYRAFSHASNVIFVLFGPLYFLSLIPLYPGKANMGDEQTLAGIEQEANCPKFLEILISYIIIPLIAVFTLILIIYIVQNISGDFWRDNLLEPMLVSYAITVILVYILASDLKNTFAVLFRKIFPKILVPIVVFQIISSIISLGDTGITHTRYYVILFGFFAAVAGILLSILPVWKNGLVAAILIVFSIISIVPPVDAFTISKNSQISLLEEVLIKHHMLEENKIRLNASIPNEDKKKITTAMNYLSMMQYTDSLPYLPKDFDLYRDFSDTFGFEEYYEPSDRHGEYIFVHLDHPLTLPIAGYDQLVEFDLYLDERIKEEKITDLEIAGQSYTLLKERKDEHVVVKLVDEQQKMLIAFETEEIFKRYTESSFRDIISLEEATFTAENDRVSLKLIVLSADMQKEAEHSNANASIYALIKIK